MVVVAALEFYFGNHSSFVIDLDADYIYFVCVLLRSHHEPMFIYRSSGVVPWQG